MSRIDLRTVLSEELVEWLNLLSDFREKLRNDPDNVNPKMLSAVTSAISTLSAAIGQRDREELARLKYESTLKADDEQVIITDDTVHRMDTATLLALLGETGNEPI